MMGILAVSVLVEFAVIMFLLIKLGSVHLQLKRLEMDLYRMGLLYGDRDLEGRSRKERL